MSDLVLVELLSGRDHLLWKVLNINLFLATDLQFWVKEADKLLAVFLVDCGNEIVRPSRECFSQHINFNYYSAI